MKKQPMKIQKPKKCCYCGHKTEEPMYYAIYGGDSGDKVGALYHCLNLENCLSRLRRNFELDIVMDNIRKNLNLDTGRTS